MTKISDYYFSVVKVNAYTNKFNWGNPLSKGINEKSSGSGFFIDKTGTILTCAHVIDSAEKITISVPGEGISKEYDVEILSICPFFDMGVLKVKNYKVKKFLNLHSSGISLKPGDEAMAIGFPLGQNNIKITKGIISGKQDNFIQIDVPINPGSSGSPLIFKDKVIGINAAGITMAENVGFATPISKFDLIKEVMYKPKNIVHYPDDLFEYQNSNKMFDKCLNSKCKGGVIITKVNSFMKQNCNISPGDILCKINDYDIDYHGTTGKKWMGQNLDIESLLSFMKLNDKIKIEYYSNGGKYNKDVFKFTEHKEKICEKFPSFEKVEYFIYGGMILMDLTTNHLNELNLVNKSNIKYLQSKSSSKIIITNILIESIVHDLKIFKTGSIIKKVNGIEVSNLKDFKKAIKKDICKDSIKIQDDDNKFVILNRKQVEKNDKAIKKQYK